jgi:ABC-type amino acid transport substrate-binding protein
MRHDNWKYVFCEQRAPGNLNIWMNPFTCLRLPKIYNLRLDPYERADITSDQLKRRYVRALVAYSKTQYSVLKGVHHGSSYEYLKAFEDASNKKYPQKQKNIRFHVVFVPVPGDKMFSHLTEGRGDLAVGALTITPDRLKVVDFSDPLVEGAKAIAITGPNSPALTTLDDLAGKEVFTRPNSSYWERL